MRFTQAITALSLFALGSAAVQPQHAPSKPTKPTPVPLAPSLTMKKVFSATIDHPPERYTLVGPFGTRVNRGFSGGNLTLPDGHVFATAFPIGTNNDLIDPQGNFHIEAFMTLGTEDGKYMYLRVEGPFPTVYVHIETDSPKYNWMNNALLVSNFTFVEPTLFLDVYQYPTNELHHPVFPNMTQS